MIAERINLDAWIVHRADGDFAICHCPQPQGREHLAYTACWADAEDFGEEDFGTGTSVDDAIDDLKRPHQRRAFA